jgi:uncharacterized protein YqjF (DUF2071 family)
MVAILSMRWRDLLFAHWAVDPATVSDRLPEGVSVDTHDGDAYLGVVPFVMADIRPRGSPVGLEFCELNLRTYVTVDGTPGVYFFSLDADDRIGVRIARWLFELPYYRAEMDVDTRRSDGDRRVEFRSERSSNRAPPARFDAVYGPDGPHSRPEPDSIEAFLTERYRFYTADGNGRLYRGDIDHERWRLAPAWADVRENALFRANGFEEPDGTAIYHFAESIDVSAARIRRV